MIDFGLYPPVDFFVGTFEQESGRGICPPGDWFFWWSCGPIKEVSVGTPEAPPYTPAVPELDTAWMLVIGLCVIALVDWIRRSM
jgi:hypothetical protein